MTCIEWSFCHIIILENCFATMFLNLSCPWFFVSNYDKHNWYILSHHKYDKCKREYHGIKKHCHVIYMCGQLWLEFTGGRGRNQKASQVQEEPVIVQNDGTEPGQSLENGAKSKAKSKLKLTLKNGSQKQEAGNSVQLETQGFVSETPSNIIPETLEPSQVGTNGQRNPLEQNLPSQNRSRPPSFFLVFSSSPFFLFRQIWFPHLNVLVQLKDY